MLRAIGAQRPLNQAARIFVVKNPGAGETADSAVACLDGLLRTFKTSRTSDRRARPRDFKGFAGFGTGGNSSSALEIA